MSNVSGIEQAAYLLLKVGLDGVTNSESAYLYDLLNFRDHISALKRRHNIKVEKLSEPPQVRYRVADQPMAKRVINIVNSFRVKRNASMLTDIECKQVLMSFLKADKEA